MEKQNLMYKIETLKQLVERILRKDERAREDDLWLYFQVLIHQGHKIFINWENMDTMPRPESVSRVRRMIQNNQFKFQPNEETLERRNKNFEESRELWRNSQYL